MNPFPILIRIAAGFVLATLAACGGGGGGGGGTTPVVYSGNTSQAAVTTMNASRLTANLFGSNETAGIIGGTSIQGGTPAPSATGMEGVTRTLNRAARRGLAQVKPTRSAQGPTSGVAQPVNFTLGCTGGGSVNTTGTLDDVTFTGTFTVTFNNCVEEGLTLNGPLTIQILAFQPFTCGLNPEDGIPTNFIATTSRITIRGNGVSIDAGGSLQVLTGIISFPMGMETVTNNLINLNNLTGVMTKAENLISTGNLDFVCTPTSISNLIFSGRVFDNVHGFVDVSTPTPFAFASVSQMFPNSGQMVLLGNTSGVVVTALSSTRVQLQPDTDGDGTGDGFMALMNWTDLGGPIGADIGNSDADQMHNSWETFYGMDPTVPGHDVLDNDGFDGNNLTEYQNGTNPNVVGM